MYERDIKMLFAAVAQTRPAGAPEIRLIRCPGAAVPVAHFLYILFEELFLFGSGIVVEIDFGHGDASGIFLQVFVKS